MTTDSKPQALELKVWRDATLPAPQGSMAFADTRAQFWKRSIQRDRMAHPEFMALEPDPISDALWQKANQTAGVVKPMREADKDLEYPVEVISQMQHTTPQFHLRNVMRLTRDVEDEYIDWAAHDLPSRDGYTEDLQEVRTARHDPPEFDSSTYGSSAVQQLQDFTRAVFVENDWEQWYGEDKKRAVGAMWQWVPPDGGKRTRPFPKDMLITPHKYWKGRLITEEY